MIRLSVSFFLSNGISLTTARLAERLRDFSLHQVPQHLQCITAALSRIGIFPIIWCDGWIWSYASKFTFLIHRSSWTGPFLKEIKKVIFLLKIK